MILIGTDDGIYRWFEGCGWPIFHGLQGRTIVGLASPGAGVLAALDHDGHVSASPNNGLDWRTIPLAEGAGRPSALAVWGTPPWIVAATQPGGLYVRPLGGKSARQAVIGPRWARLTTKLRGATAVAEPPSDGLAGWTALQAPTDQWAEVRALASGAGATAPWFAAVRGAGLWRSVDAGDSWQPCPGLPAEVFAIRTVAERVYLGTSDGCRFSPDAGASWEDRSGGLDKGRFVSAVEVKPGAPDTLLAGVGPFAPADAAANTQPDAGYALFESRNGGKSWTHVIKRGHPEVLERDSIADIRYDPAAPDNIIVAHTSGELQVTQNDGAYFFPLARQFRAARALCALA